MKASVPLCVAALLSACGVPEAEDDKTSRAEAQAMYLMPFDPGVLENSKAWDEVVKEYSAL